MSAEAKITPGRWTFLTNHAHVLLCLSKSPAKRMKELATEVGITERAVQRIIADLAEDGYLEIEREGRRNSYKMNAEKHLRHPIESHRLVADLLLLIQESSEILPLQSPAQEAANQNNN